MPTPTPATPSSCDLTSKTFWASMASTHGVPQARQILLGKLDSIAGCRWPSEEEQHAMFQAVRQAGEAVLGPVKWPEGEPLATS